MWNKGETFSFAHPEEYKIVGVAGSGAYAVVCKAEVIGSPAVAAASCYSVGSDAAASAEESPPFPSVVAIKKIEDFRSVDRTVSEQWETHYLRKVLREVEILIHFQSVPQVIPLNELYLCDKGKDIYLVMPFYEHNLRDVIERTPLTEDLVKWLVFQILLAIDVVHRCGVIHRDLTLGNVLVDSSSGEWECRLADFGLSRARETVDRDITLDVVTLPYRAPELLLQYPEYSSKVDIWSLGCIMAELVLRRPFLYVQNKNPDPMRQLKLIFKSLTGFPDLAEVPDAASKSTARWLVEWKAGLELEGMTIPAATDVGEFFKDTNGNPVLSPDGIDVLRRALVFSPHKRASAAELLQMPWFSNDPGLQEMLAERARAPLPAQFTEYVEKMTVEEMVALLEQRVRGRKARLVSQVSPSVPEGATSPGAVVPPPPGEAVPPPGAAAT